MMNWIGILLAVFFFSIQPLAMRKIEIHSLRENILQTGVFSSLVAVCFWIWALAAHFTFSAATILWGIVFGCGLIVTIACYYYAMHTGPLSYTSFFYSASMVIPALAGCLFWNETLHVTALIGILLFLVAFYCVSVLGGTSGGKVSRRWLLLCFATWLLNGSLSVIVKIQQSATGGKEASSLTTIAFSCSCILALTVYVVLAALHDTPAEKSAECRSLGTYAGQLVLLALGNGGGNCTITWLSARVSSAYLFPVVLGGMMVVVTLYSVLVLHEKLSHGGIAGLVLGAAALLILNIP